MEVEQMEVEEGNNNLLINQINQRAKKLKKSKYNIDLKTISIYSIFLITLIAFIILYNLYPNINYNVYSLEKNEKNKLVKNDCEIGYKLVGGKCVVNYSVKAEYETHKDIEQVELIKITQNEAILELIVDGDKVKPMNKYIFQNKGKHTVFMLLDLDKIDNLEGLFSGIISFASVNLSELFNSEKFISISGMFRNCKSLKTVDFSKFNTKNILLKKIAMTQSNLNQNPLILK